MKKQLLTVLALIVGVIISISATAQTTTTYVFESNEQEELIYDTSKQAFRSSGVVYASEFKIEVSPTKLIIKQRGDVVFNEPIMPSKSESFDNWNIYGFYGVKNNGLTVSLLINKEKEILETGEYGVLWVCERNSSKTVGLSFTLNKHTGIIVTESSLNLGIE